MDKYILKKWDPGLRGPKFCAVTNDLNVMPLKNIDLPKVYEISGAYAKYREGVFAVWCDLENKETWISWNGSSAKINSDCKVIWVSEPFYRQFAIETASGQSISFRYKTLLYEPWILITEYLLLAPDDDWGLVFDLPSWVHSSHMQGSLKEDLRKWIDSEKGL